MVLNPASFRFLVLFNSNFTEEIVDFGGIQTRIVQVVTLPLDHLHGPRIAGCLNDKVAARCRHNFDIHTITICVDHIYCNLGLILQKILNTQNEMVPQQVCTRFSALGLIGMLHRYQDLIHLEALSAHFSIICGAICAYCLGTNKTYIKQFWCNIITIDSLTDFHLNLWCHWFHVHSLPIWGETLDSRGG